MSTVTKDVLSGSTHGRGIEVTTASPLDGSDTTIHTGPDGTDADTCDWVTLYATNKGSDPVELHLGWGGTTDPDDQILQTIPSKSGLTLLVLELPIRNSLSVVASAAGAPGEVVIFGSVKKVRP
jgi:hypothetical protein